MIEDACTRCSPEAPEAFRRARWTSTSRENNDLLFDSREECLGPGARENYDGLVDGSIGGNLLSKYSMIGRFFATKAALDFLSLTIQAARKDAGEEPNPEGLDCVMGYMRAAMLHVPFAEEMAAPIEWPAAFDVEAWARDDYAKPLEDYAFEGGPALFEASMDPEREALIRTKVDTFGEHPSGLGKFTRTMFARDLRRTFARKPTS